MVCLIYDTNIDLNKRLKLKEEQLLSDARNGDHNAFKKLIRKYENQVAATVISMLGYGPEAEDVGQETFIRFYKALGKFRGDSSLGTYLTRIAVNLSLNELKRRQRHRKFFNAKSADKLPNLPDLKRSNKHNESKKIVRWGLQKLAPKFRTVLVLRMINGYTSRETAEILDLPIGTVLSRLARGQDKLKKILSPLLWEKNRRKGDGDE